MKKTLFVLYCLYFFLLVADFAFVRERTRFFVDLTGERPFNGFRVRVEPQTLSVTQIAPDTIRLSGKASFKRQKFNGFLELRESIPIRMTIRKEGTVSNLPVILSFREIAFGQMFAPDDSLPSGKSLSFAVVEDAFFKFGFSVEETNILFHLRVFILLAAACLILYSFGQKDDADVSGIGRIVYLDYLRVFAIFSVVLLHTAAQNWYYNTSSFDWLVFNSYHSAVRWNIPVFVMISGALFLGRDIPVQKIFGKYVKRLLAAFLFWSAAYYAYKYFVYGDTQIITLIVGEFHMWFIPMIALLYVSTPVLNKIIKDEKLLDYTLLLVAVFIFTLPFIRRLLLDFLPQEFTLTVPPSIREEREFFLKYASYFIIGYYISKTEIKEKARKIVYALGFLSLLSTIALTAYLSVSNDAAADVYYNIKYTNVFFQSVAVFVWFKYARLPENTVIRRLADCTFGIFLIHVMVMQVLRDYFKLFPSSFHPIISVPVISALIFVISAVLTMGLKKIPVAKKYIV